MQIKTPEDWWKLLYDHWDDLVQSMVNAGLNEEEISQAETAKKDKDWIEMEEILNMAWWRAPDEPVIHTWPSWHVLCDLCSEAWVFSENK